MHKIELRRRELGFTIAEVAELTDIATSTISRIEAERPGDFKINWTTALALAAGLDCQLHTLFESNELSELGRPAKTGGNVVDITSRKRQKTPYRCSECHTESSPGEVTKNVSDCHEVSLVAVS